MAEITECREPRRSSTMIRCMVHPEPRSMSLEEVGTTVGGEREGCPEGRRQKLARAGATRFLHLSAPQNPLRSYRHCGGRSTP